MEQHGTLLVLGLLIAAIGCFNLKGNASTVHWYNRRKVSQEDMPKYAKTVGIGTLIIGLGLVASIWLSWLITPSIVVGLGFILYAQFKYNHGLF